VASACACDKLQNCAMDGGEILHADQCRACVTYRLGLMSIGVITGKKNVLDFAACRLPQASSNMDGGSPAVIGQGQQQWPGQPGC